MPNKLVGVKGRTKIRNNRIIQNPDAGHNDLCAPTSEIEAETIILKRNMMKRTENGSNPIAAYREGINKIPIRFNDQALAAEIELFEFL